MKQAVPVEGGRRTAPWLWLLLLLLTLLAFYPMFQNGFVWDDPTFVVGNQAIRGLWPPSRFFQSHGLAAKGTFNNLTGDRPVMVFSLALDYAFWRLNLFGYHLTNLLLHLLCVFGVVWLAFSFTRSRMAAFLAGALFALHPGHAEGVIAFAGRSDLLACLFVLLGFWGYYRHRETGGWRRAVWYGASLLSFLLACFSKEPGLALLGLLVVYEVFGVVESRIRNLKSKIIRLLPFVLVGFVYWVHRGKVLGGQFADSVWWGGSPYKNFLMAFEVYARYLRLLFFPLSLSPLQEVPVPGGFWDGTVLWGAALVLGSLVGAAWSLRRHPRIGFLISWFLIGLVPVANLIPVPGLIAEEHRLYLPSVGACVLGGWGAWVLYGRARNWTKGAWIVLVAGALILLGVRTFLWIPAWRTEESVARAMLASSPQSAPAHYNLGYALGQQGRYGEAEKELRQAIALDPNYAEAYSNLGNALGMQGYPEEAIAAYRQAIALKPDFAEAYSNLGDALRKQGYPEEAIAACRQAIELKPDFADAYNNLGSALRQQGKTDEAIAACRQAIALKPDDAEAYNNLGIALGMQQKYEQAIAAFRQDNELKPDDAEAYSNLGIALRQQGKIEEAIAAYRQAIALKPGAAGAYNNLGNALADQGKTGEAIAAYRQAIALNPDFILTLESLAVLLDKQGQRKEARGYWERAEKLETRPEWVERIQKRLSEPR
jgi:tetratricopeptide (TPR) repeat protein